MSSLIATVDNDPASTATVNIEGSILLEPPAAQRPNSTGTAAIDCANSEVPNVNQAQAATVGAINCATAGNGNTYTPTVADIFAHPGDTYTLNPNWSGVDSLKPEAITLPGALTPSTTDLASQARAQNAQHTCLGTMQDKGALELPGYPGSQPEPQITVPIQIIAGTPATFTVTATADVTFAWQDSNDTRGNGRTFTDTFTTPGNYTITLEASGGPGCKQTVSRTIAAERPAIPADPAAVSTTLPPALVCDRARLTLTDVAIKHDLVSLTGAAEPRLAGKPVAIFSKEQRVASAIVSRDGRFHAFAPLPPISIRASNMARYQARISGLRSLDLKLTRRLVLEPPRSKHGTVTLEGQVLAPLTQPAAPILIWQENATCTHAAIIARITPRSNGHYTIRLPAPEGQQSAIYRLSTHVQATATNPRRFPTFSLTEAVKLK
jgi:hypothetical protein